MNESKTATRVLCPECKGYKTRMYLDDKCEREESACHTCEGEGIVIEVIEKTIKSLKNG